MVVFIPFTVSHSLRSFCPAKQNVWDVHLDSGVLRGFTDGRWIHSHV